MASSLNVSVISFYQSVGGVIRMIFAAVFGLFATIAVDQPLDELALSRGDTTVLGLAGLAIGGN